MDNTSPKARAYRDSDGNIFKVVKAMPTGTMYVGRYACPKKPNAWHCIAQLGLRTNINTAQRDLDRYAVSAGLREVRKQAAGRPAPDATMSKPDAPTRGDQAVEGPARVPPPARPGRQGARK